VKYIRSRAVGIFPNVVSKVVPADLNVVLQVPQLPPDRRFDLIIGTNIFLYYGSFEQALVRANLGNIIQPGGFLLSNNALPGTAPSLLTDSLQTQVTIRPGVVDRIFSYVRKK
jgi:predicted TPR repeat methyltransferase